ncbi:cytochrome P450 2J4 isoform X2 [Patella vulgata]|uniref:cytochrome P450 2J4 isoform X2 n=1 Tax=Patella vulgata TaxID=6465 RepID=UPI00217FBD9B|nr:cytochrome P450 2J4 isoform X2 [Patella vulgata]
MEIPGVIFANGKEWEALRRMSLITLRGFGVGKQTIEERIKDEVKAIIDVLEETSRQPFHIKYYLSRAITNITCSILFGHRFDYDDPKFKELLDALEIYFKMENTSSPINALPWLRYLPTKRQDVSTIMAPIKVWSEFTVDQVEKHKETFDTNNIRDFIDVYLQTKNSLEEDEDIITVGNIFRMILDLFGAGTETTATSLDWVFLYMIGYPEIQRKCQEEIAKVVGNGCSVSLADRRKLPYVHATLNEIQRICNVAPTTIPHGLTEDVIFQGYSLPKHSIVIIDLMSVHKDPKYWQDPHLFKPERFLDHNGHLICRKAFMPFSEGPRKCLGESLARSELFLIFSNLLQVYDFTRVNGNEVNFHGFHGKTLSPKPYELNIVSR